MFTIPQFSRLKVVALGLGLVVSVIASEIQKREIKEAVEKALTERGLDK